MTTVAARLSIRGRVQGVYYRASTQAEAKARGLTGWVRNEPDRSVSAWLQGERDVVDAMIAWCHEGPPSARVDAVQVQWVDPDAACTTFAVRR